MDSVQLAARAQHLIAVRELPSWQAVREVFRAKEELFVDRLCSNQEMTHQEQDYARGFVAGIRYVLQTVEKGEKQYLKAVQRQRDEEETPVG